MRAWVFGFVALLAGCSSYQIQQTVGAPVCVVLGCIQPQPASQPFTVPTPKPVLAQSTPAIPSADEQRILDVMNGTHLAPPEPEPAPQWVTVQNVGPYQGAAVCSNYNDVQVFMKVQIQYQEDVLADRLTRGQTALMRGAPRKPWPEAFGCALLPAGTRVLADFSNVVPLVHAKIGNRTIVGVTNPAFLKR